MQTTSHISKCLLFGSFFVFLAEAASSANSIDPTLDYDIFPLREQEKAAIVEWGHSAILSALDAAVADFGVHTSQSAFFEVETSPILAQPVDGRGERSDIPEDEDDIEGVPYPGRLLNAREAHGNMVVMTNHAGMSGVAMARIAKESGAAALMVVNVDDENPDFIFSLQAETEEERKYAEEHIDFPVIMVSLASGNLITTATVEEGMAEHEIVNNGMPDRVRLYAAGDRPFFEDVSNQNPVLYLIHNLLTQDECEMLLKQSQGKFDKLDDSVSNLLENIVAEPSQKAINIETTMMWKGQLNNHAGKQIEERIEQVTGYPQDQFSDWQISKFVQGARHELHYDHHPLYSPVATISVFLNHLDDNDSGGEVVFPNPVQGSPVMITPQQGLAVVHHNTDYEGNVDYSAVYGEMNVRGKDQVKYIARKYVYAQPLPPSKRIILPLLALVNGGKLPRLVVNIHDLFIAKFGLESGNVYFDKLCTMYPILVLLMIGTIIQRIFQSKLSALEKPKTEKKPPKKSSGKKKGKKGKKE
mmetsp:Transcript_25731/g.31707  ORF Transcript_25731/g.31707 Transcript_25731/m.31707 type:complete len:529 (-) Transcript_25731:86-1672(-)